MGTAIRHYLWRERGIAYHILAGLIPVRHGGKGPKRAVAFRTAMGAWDMTWLFLAGLLALVAYVHKATASKPNRPRRNRPAIPLDPAFAAAVQAWQAELLGILDGSPWIASGQAEAIARRNPPPERAQEFRSLAATDPSPVERVRRELAVHNQRFLASQHTRRADFFRTVERNPLTDEQVHACVCMEESVLVVAAAGSGKTSTLVAKTGYALTEGLAGPTEILLLAFNAEAAREIAQRVSERLRDIPDVDLVTSRTFHALGLEIIGQVTGKKPSIAPWIEQPGKDIDQVVSIVGDISKTDMRFKMEWDLLRTVFARDLGDPLARLVPDAFRGGKSGLLTANGEIVKSHQELRIADWLFYNGINYEYERPYEHDTADQTHRQYQPDFYYPDIKLYHEHLALDANGQAPVEFGRGYVEGVKWKRDLHARMGTALFETTSQGFTDRTALPGLERELRRRGLNPVFDRQRLSERNGTRATPDGKLAGTIRVFQQHVKNNALQPSQLQAALVQRFGKGHDERSAMFLSVYVRIAEEWERRLKEGGYVDFDDMLIQAAEFVEADRYRSPFTLIMADEFQDSSRTRVRLLKSLASRAGKRRYLCVVGDDWQGINRFAGADITVMTRFEQLFDHPTTLMLGTTFRCPPAVCEISSRFVQANPIQIRKEVSTTNTYDKDPIQALAFDEEEAIVPHVEGLLRQMHGYVLDRKLSPSRGERLTVLLLGRYRRDEPVELAQWQREFGTTMSVEFRTVHASKGLEAEYVFLLNAFEGKHGFPSQVDDDPVLRLSMPEADAFEFAEERRLFYVALTRASRQIRICTSIKRPSRFIAQAGIRLTVVGGQILEPCKRCGEGVMRMRNGKNGKFMACSAYPRCRYTVNVVECEEA